LFLIKRCHFYQGAEGEVFKVINKSTHRKYAMKVIGKPYIRRLKEKLNREIKIMYLIQHPNVLKLHTHFEDKDKVYMIMELIEGVILLVFPS